MKKVVGAMVLVSAVMAKEPNMQLIEQQILSNDITIKNVYEAPLLSNRWLIQQFCRAGGCK